MLNIDLEPLKQLYQEILNTQALSEKELKALKYLIDKLQETKEEFENSSFSVLEKNNELFNQSNTILQNIKNLSNMLNNLEDELKKEKMTFDEDIKQKIKNLVKNVEDDLKSLEYHIQGSKRFIDEEFNQFFELCITNNKKLEETKKEIEKITQEYQDTLNNSLNNSKLQITRYKEELENQVKKKTFFARWGAVIIALSIGFLAGAGGMFYIKAKAFKQLATANLQVVKKQYDEEINRIEALIGAKVYQRFIKPYKIEFVTGQDGYRYIAVPINKVKQVYSNNKFQVIQLKRQ